MSDHNSEVKGPKYSAPKDKNCPFCGQAFTSSSLGRHLDLYIKEKNPKPADGIHDVDAIRKMRGSITRRHPRGSLGGRRESSTPIGTPRAAVTKEKVSTERNGHRSSSAIPKDGQFAVDSALSRYPFPPRWEATGVINDIGEAASDAGKRPSMQRAVSKQQAHKAQFDIKNKLADAMDTARAAELALRELLSSWRAAKQQIDANSMPFDFDPLSLDFPALTLQCLHPPPTLFSSTQHPTSTSWSVNYPTEREFVALQGYFQEQFRSWKVTCVTATTDVVEELTYPPSNAPVRDRREMIKKAEQSAEHLEKQVNEHLQSAYNVWESLLPARKHEVWVLELARSVGRKQKETKKMKADQHKLQQENANLKSQIDQLNRLQQPREFKIMSPNTFPMEKEVISHAFEQGLKGATAVGFSLEDRQLDLNSVVTKSIERWKNVVTTNRATNGMNGQKSLDQQSQPSEPATNGSSSSVPRSQTQTPQQHIQPHEPPKRLSTASTSGAVSEQTAASTNTTAPPSVEETSDQDADAEMEDDDSFAMMGASPAKQHMPTQQMPPQATLEVPRTRPMQQRAPPDPRFMMQNGTGSPVGRTAMNMSRSMPNINMAMQTNGMHGADMSMAMQGMRGDGMYME